LYQKKWKSTFFIIIATVRKLHRRCQNIFHPFIMWAGDKYMVLCPHPVWATALLEGCTGER